MKHLNRLQSLGLFNTRVPRYTSYPTSPVFSSAIGAAQQANSLAALDPAIPVSIYIHIPFCERLCWFCACRTQGTSSLSPVESYIGTLEGELAILRNLLPEGMRMGRMHWGGGTPTILPPQLIHRLARAVRDVIPSTEDCEFSVEIDPTMVDRAKIQALADERMTRASIGIQDFDTLVQRAIGRLQSFEETQVCVEELRCAGITSLNTDLVYGLPHQDADRINNTVSKVLQLEPDRVALFGYAHVPWMSKRQRLIKDEDLPDDLARFDLATKAANRFREAGFTDIGIDHFARSDDGLATAAKMGHLRRNFQGYTDDTCPTLIGIGASSISRLPDGYVQNTPMTPAYTRRIEAGELAGAKGHVLTDDDLIRSRAIEMLMCDFTLDRDQLRARFGGLAATLDPTLALVAAQFGDLVEVTETGLTITPKGRPLTRIIASAFDAHKPEGVRYSQAS